MRNAYDAAELEKVLERVLSEIGADRFSHLKLLELERVVRLKDPDGRLPGKTLLRAAINQFREARWPGTGPKRRGTHPRFY